MAYTFKEGQGSLFKNEKLNDRQPDWRGSININGTMYDIAGWSRTSQGGKEYVSLQASLPRQQSSYQQDGGAQRQSYGNRQYNAPQSSNYGAPQPPMPSASDMPEDLCEDLPF